MNVKERVFLRRLSVAMTALTDLVPMNNADIYRISLMCRTSGVVGKRAASALACASDDALGGIDSALDDLAEIEKCIQQAKMAVRQRDPAT